MLCLDPCCQDCGEPAQSYSETTCAWGEFGIVALIVKEGVPCSTASTIQQSFRLERDDHG